MEEFFTPPNHVNFYAKKLFGEGRIKDISIARIEESGGGPVQNHTHSHDHFFIVTEGEAKILLDGEEKILKKNESFLVDGEIPHSVWNNINGITTMIGITIEKQTKFKEL